MTLPWCLSIPSVPVLNDTLGKRHPAVTLQGLRYSVHREILAAVNFIFYTFWLLDLWNCDYFPKSIIDICIAFYQAQILTHTHTHTHLWGERYIDLHISLSVYLSIYLSISIYLYIYIPVAPKFDPYLVTALKLPEKLKYRFPITTELIQYSFWLR